MNRFLLASLLSLTLAQPLVAAPLSSEDIAHRCHFYSLLAFDAALARDHKINLRHFITSIGQQTPEMYELRKNLVLDVSPQKSGG